MYKDKHLIHCINLNYLSESSVQKLFKDVTKVAEKPTLKVQVGLRVYVPLSERETAVHNVKSSLDGDGIETSSPFVALH